jgi:hypothetical protein
VVLFVIRIAGLLPVGAELLPQTAQPIKIVIHGLDNGALVLFVKDFVPIARSIQFVPDDLSQIIFSFVQSVCGIISK